MKSYRTKSKGEGRKCFLCHKGHFKKHFSLNKSKKASSSKHAAETSATNVTNGYDSTKVLMVYHKDMKDAWIMDS